MTKFLLSTDSCCDMPASYYNERDIKYVKLLYLINGEDHYDEQSEKTINDFYAAMRSKCDVRTSGVNVGDYLTMWEEMITHGLPILHISFSSGLSVTYSNAMTARGTFLETHPEARIYIVDSLSASMGQGLLVHYAANMRDEGASIEEAHKWVEANKLKFCHEFTVDDLEYLKRGGRVSPAAAFFGTMLDIKPVLFVDNAGHLIPRTKTRGRKKSIKALETRMEELAVEPENQTIFISHGDCLEDAQLLADMINQAMHPKEIKIGYVGPVVGAHSGPGTLALFYIGKSRE